jgi:hypothetical protein
MVEWGGFSVPMACHYNDHPPLRHNAVNEILLMLLSEWDMSRVMKKNTHSAEP